MSPGEAHQILELNPPYTREELEAAYHEALAFWHPSHFAEDEVRLNEAMDRNISINEAYRVLTASPTENKATSPRLTLPAAPALAEPKVEKVPPRILGPRLRLPPSPKTCTVPTPPPSRSHVASGSSSGPASPAVRPVGSAATSPAPALLQVSRVPVQAEKHPPIVPWIIGIGGVLAVMLVWSFTQAGVKSRAQAPKGTRSAGPAVASTAHSPSQPLPAPMLPTRLPVDMKPLYEQATVKNDPAAQRKMGHAYEHGLGVPVDLNEAIIWYRKAASGGDEDARTALEAIRR